MFLMWLGEQITERGLGNGISMLIFAGIAAGLPNAIGGLVELVRTGSMNTLTALIICVIVAVVTFLVVFHPKRSASYPGQLCKTTDRQQDLWRAKQLFAAQGQHGRCYSADFCLVDHPVSRQRIVGWLRLPVQSRTIYSSITLFVRTLPHRGGHRANRFMPFCMRLPSSFSVSFIPHLWYSTAAKRQIT